MKKIKAILVVVMIVATAGIATAVTLSRADENSSNSADTYKPNSNVAQTNGTLALPQGNTNNSGTNVNPNEAVIPVADFTVVQTALEYEEKAKVGGGVTYFSYVYKNECDVSDVQDASDLANKLYACLSQGNAGNWKRFQTLSNTNLMDGYGTYNYQDASGNQYVREFYVRRAVKDIDKDPVIKYSLAATRACPKSDYDTSGCSTPWQSNNLYRDAGLVNVVPENQRYFGGVGAFTYNNELTLSLLANYDTVFTGQEGDRWDNNVEGYFSMWRMEPTGDVDWSGNPSGILGWTHAEIHDDLIGDERIHDNTEIIGYDAFAVETEAGDYLAQYLLIDNVYPGNVIPDPYVRIRTCPISGNGNVSWGTCVVHDMSTYNISDYVSDAPPAGESMWRDLGVFAY